MLSILLTQENIVLDPKIRDWVLMPILIVMFLQGILRQYASVLLADQPKVNKSTLQKNLLLRRSNRLRVNSHVLPLASFRMRKAYFVSRAFRDRSANPTDPNDPNSASSADADSTGSNAPSGEDRRDGDNAASGDANPFQDPFAMVGMMKQNMAMLIPSLVLFAWVSFFFSGFVLVKLPFGSTDRLKAMLQRGIFLRSLDPSYVSSISWYFINFFGLRGLFSLVLGDNNATDNAKIMQEQMMGGAAMQQQVDFNQLFSQERTELEIVQHEWSVPGAEYRLLGKTPPR